MTIPPEQPRIKLALCLPGGGFTGALYQIGALAAIGDGMHGVGGHAYSIYLGCGTGASVAAAAGDCASGATPSGCWPN